MKQGLLLSLFLFLGAAYGQSDDSVHSNELTIQQKIKIVQTFKEFAYAFEKSNPVDPKNKTVFIPSLIKEAHAASGEACMVAGWMSSRGSDGLCIVPPEAKKGGCGNDQISCGSPIPFGDNICIPFSTPAVRNNAFNNCDKEFDKKKRSLAQVVDRVSEEEFNKYAKDVKSVCQNKSTIQSNSSMCRELLSKFNEYIPGDQSGEMGRAQKAIEKEDIAGIEKSVPKLKDELLEAQDSFKKKGCASINKKDPSQYDKYAECAVISKKIVKLNDLMSRSLGVLQSIAGTEPCSGEPSKGASSLAADGLKVAGQTTCSEAEKKQNSDSCMKDVGCVIASDLAGPFLMLSDYIYKPEKSCVSSQNSCIANVLSQAVRSAWSTITGVWDLLKAGWDTVKDKASRMWTSMWGAEDKTSDAQNAIKNLSAEDKDQISKNPLDWMKGLMTNMWTATQDYLKNDVYCEKWSGSVPGQGECSQPFRGFECMNCGRALTSNCAAFGVVVGEVLPAVLTGGVSGAAKVGAKGASAIGKYIKASKVGQAIAKKMAAIPGASKAAAVTTSALKTSASVIGTGAKAASERVGKILEGLKNSKAMQEVSKQATALLEHPMVRPVTAVAEATAKVQTAAFKLGEDAVLGTTSKATEAVSALTKAGKTERVLEAASEAPVTSISAEARGGSAAVSSLPVETPSTNLGSVQKLRELEAERVDDALKADTARRAEDQARRVSEADRIDEALKADATRRAAEEEAARVAEAKRVAEADRVDNALFKHESDKAIAEAEKEIAQKTREREFTKAKKNSEAFEVDDSDRQAIARQLEVSKARRDAEVFEVDQTTRDALNQQIEAANAKRAAEAVPPKEVQVAQEAPASKAVAEIKPEKSVALVVESNPSSVSAPSSVVTREPTSGTVARASENNNFGSKYQGKSDQDLEKDLYKAVDYSQSAEKKLVSEYREKLYQQIDEDRARGGFANFREYGDAKAKVRTAYDSSIKDKMKDDPDFADRLKRIQKEHKEATSEIKAERERRAEEAAKKPLTDEGKQKVRDNADYDWNKEVTNNGEDKFFQGPKYNGKVVTGSKGSQDEIRTAYLNEIARRSEVPEKYTNLIAASPRYSAGEAEAAFGKLFRDTVAPDLREAHSVLALRPSDAATLMSNEMKSARTLYDRLMSARPEELRGIDPAQVEYYKKRLKPYVCFENPEQCR